jgi:type VI secretion system protein VasD
MMAEHFRFRFRTPWIALPLCALLGACQSDPEVIHHPAIAMSMTADTAVNPYPDGQPAPVVARVYQLSAKDRFMVADPMQLIQHDAQTLGDDQLGRDEFIFAPGTTRSITLPGNDKAHFIGIVAAYRAIDKDDWRALVAVPDGGKALSVAVTLGATGLQVSPAVAPAQK